MPLVQGRELPFDPEPGGLPCGTDHSDAAAPLPQNLPIPLFRQKARSALQRIAQAVKALGFELYSRRFKFL
jgi:hypothetical protein